MKPVIVGGVMCFMAVSYFLSTHVVNDALETFMLLFGVAGITVLGVGAFCED